MKEDKHLYILWTNADVLTSKHMVMMYATNAMLRKWWDNVTVIIWGATAKLVSEDEDIQSSIKMAMQAGVEFTACVACANNLEVKEDLEKLNIEVMPWGMGLTEILQNNQKLITI
ncbi:MAG: DsrE family protein [Eubacteriaceae bacterium]